VERKSRVDPHRHAASSSPKSRDRVVPLNHLVGFDSSIGDARIYGIRLCEPCHHLQRVTGKELIKRLRHCGGLRAQILTQARCTSETR
jgi:hypothetical protein